MKLEIDLADVHAAQTQSELEVALQRFAEKLGFASYCFVDGSTTHSLKPYHVDTDKRWSSEYAQQGFVDFDPILTKAWRVNVPFSWESVDVPKSRAQVKPGAIRTMEAALDHGFTEGLVVPFHFADRLGRKCSMLCTFFWRDRPRDFTRIMTTGSTEIHLYLLYWMERSVELREREMVGRNVIAITEPQNKLYLTDRERDVLSWAARGKTAPETAAILGINQQTVQEHVRRACDRLGAGNKTHAVAKAIVIGVIDV